MALYSVVMLNISLELALTDAAYEDMAIKFLEHFTSIADAINQMSDGFGLWDPEDGFYYDHFHREQDFFPLRVRSMVGLIPLVTSLVLDGKYLDNLPGFRKQLNWFMENRRDRAAQVRRVLFISYTHPRVECNFCSYHTHTRLDPIRAETRLWRQIVNK